MNCQTDRLRYIRTPITPRVVLNFSEQPNGDIWVFLDSIWKSKIIELSGAELQKLRVSVQKLQLQNWNLARSNSQMLAVWLLFALLSV